jgi:hypothetical protein
MPEIKVNIEGLEESWQGWVLPKGEEEYKELSTRLKPIVRSLARRPVELTPISKLVEYYDDIDRLTQDPDSGVNDAEVAIYLSRITQKVQEITSKESKERPAFRELPLHIGAVFEKGRNYLLVEHESIPTMSITNKDHRQAYMLENLHAFNTLFRQPQSWKPAVDIWLADAKFAAKAEGLSSEDFEDFSKQLKAMMAITASARAMEESAGASVSYLVTLTGGERGNLDAQDLIRDFLVHSDSSKLNKVLKSPLVKKYYNILMKDAGLINDEDHRWSKIDDPEHPGNPSRELDVPSKVEFIKDPLVLKDPRVSKKSSAYKDALAFTDSVREGVLVEYLKDSAEEGGFDSYINEVLLKKDTAAHKRKLKEKGIDEDSRWEAAKLACDAFLIDQWTRWEAVIGDEDIKGKVKVPEKLSPIQTWGGDPLKLILEPAFLPRLKNVYSGGDKVILEMMDKVFRPTDVFKGDLEREMMVPSMVHNLKKYARFSEAIFTFLGGSMSTSIPAWNRKIMEEELPKMMDLLTQVYGGAKKRDLKAGKAEKVGKEIVGDMAMRLLYTKALASTIETTKLGFNEKMKILFDPQGETRPFLDVMRYLYGVNLDGKSGFIQSLIGGRTRLVIKDNRFKAEEFYKKTWEVLQTNDDTAGSGQAARLNKVGFLLDIAQSLAGAFTGYKKR